MILKENNMSQIPIPGGTASGLQSHGPVYGDSQSGTIPPSPQIVDTPAVLVNGAVAATAAVGNTLTCTMGNWLCQPTSYVGRWKSDGTVDLADGPFYDVTADDVGHNITCLVTARNAFGETIAPPSNAVSVAAAGTLTRGRR
jgi:hypothetical protein